jgi:predicted amidohydrolase YtcJ
LKILAVIALMCLLASACSPKNSVPQEKDMADRIFYNGVIRTMDPDQPWAEAAAVREGVFIRVGTNDEVMNEAGPGTDKVDLGGAFVCPGFIDSHTHFLEGGFALLCVKLRDAGSREEFVRRIAEKAGRLEEGRWILNGDWDHQNFDPVELPTRQWIDAVTSANPVCVNRLDGHMVLANSLALNLAGITGETPSPQGGEIVRDPETEEPTGILKDAAIDLLTEVIPKPSSAEKKEAALRAMDFARSMGVTSVHDMAYEDNLDVYAGILAEGEPPTRVSVYIQITDIDRFQEIKAKVPEGNRFLKLSGLKGFVDGSLGSSTALFFEPYTDDPSKTGLLYSQMYPEGIMTQRLMKADALNLQAAVHAIGDRANAVILDIYEEVAAAHGPRDRRWRIEHAQHLRPVDIPRFGKLGVIASVQPYHAYDDGRWAETKIGPERAKTTYAFKSLLKGGALLSFGSDWTVAPLDPIMGIYAAVTRQTSDGDFSDGWTPEEKISVEEALRAYTGQAAYAEFAEDIKGTITVGKLADMVVLSRNLLDIPAETIPGTAVLKTIMGGRIVYDNNK